MRRIFFTLSALFLLAACGRELKPASAIIVDPVGTLAHILLVDSQGKRIPFDVEIASTPEARQTGLMHRSTVEHGMLFTFDTSSVLMFWMKDTLVPLDILFFDADGAEVSALTMQPCMADPCPLYRSDGPARYALELPVGFLDAYGKSGWKLYAK